MTLKPALLHSIVVAVTDMRKGEAAGQVAETTLARLVEQLRREFLDYDVFVSDSEVEKRWKVKAGYCQMPRGAGGGPKYYRLSPRVLRYKLGDIIEFENSREFASLADELARESA
jgi:hypothetical protein